MEGGRALCRLAFERLALPRLLGFCRADNAAVPTVLQRLGFQDCGSCDYADQSALRFELDRSRWLALNASAP